MASAIRSIALPICGRAVFTAAATFASSALIMWAISSEDFRSRSDATAFVFLAPGWLKPDWLPRFFKSLSPEIALATQKPLAASDRRARRELRIRRGSQIGDFLRVLCDCSAHFAVKSFS